MDKMSFLNQYRKEVMLVDKLESSLKETIPKQWFEILNEEDKKVRIEKTLNLWKSLFKKEFSHSIMYLTKHLMNVELIIDHGVYTILYSIHDPQGNIMYYEGGLPPSSINRSHLKLSWSDVPDKLKKFYEILHNGFYYFPSRAMGLVSLNDLTFFQDNEWGIMDELEEPLRINLGKTVGFFESGMGGYLAIDLENCRNDHATLWFTNDQPEYEVNFWHVADEWLLIGFEE